MRGRTQRLREKARNPLERAQELLRTQSLKITGVERLVLSAGRTWDQAKASPFQVSIDCFRRGKLLKQEVIARLKQVSALRKVFRNLRILRAACGNQTWRTEAWVLLVPETRITIPQEYFKMIKIQQIEG